jgi:hypothetical protein
VLLSIHVWLRVGYDSCGLSNEEEALSRGGASKLVGGKVSI